MFGTGTASRSSGELEGDDEGYSPYYSESGGALELISTCQAVLKQFQLANNKASPKRLIVYRDGLSEGELQRVCGHELQQIRGTASLNSE